MKNPTRATKLFSLFIPFSLSRLHDVLLCRGEPGIDGEREQQKKKKKKKKKKKAKADRQDSFTVVRQRGLLPVEDRR